MAETEVNVVNRPAFAASAVGALLQAWPVLAAIGAAVFTFGVWLVHLEGKTDGNATDIAKIVASNTERDARWIADQKTQNDRVDRIEESRSQNLQRLATVEEAVKGINRRLDSIDGKLDRALMGRASARQRRRHAERRQGRLLRTTASSRGEEQCAVSRFIHKP